MITALAIAVAQVLVFYSTGGSLGDRFLRDTDSYMWMNRVMYLVGDGSWWDHVYPRINPPEGHQQHWTRPLDLILVVGGGLFGLVLGFGSGLYHFAVAFPTALHMAAAGVVVWMARPLVRAGLLPGGRVPLLLLVLFALVPIYQPFLVARPDHHAPLALLFFIHLALWIHLTLDRSPSGRTGLALGLVNALALWINPEALIYIVIGMGALFLLWILTGDRRVARCNALYGAGIAAGIAVAVFVEFGPAMFTERKMDVVTYPHAVLMLLVAGFWTTLYLRTASGEADTLRRRLWTGGASAAGVFAIFLPLFPEFLTDPLGETDPLYRATRLERITELQSLWSFGVGWLGGVGQVLLYAGAGIGAVAFLGYRLARDRDRRVVVLWLGFLLMSGTYLVLSLRQARWSDYLGIAALVPFALLAAALLDRWSPAGKGMPARVGRSLLMLGLTAAPLWLGAAFTAAAGEGPGPSERVQTLEAAWLDAGDPDELPEDRSCSLVEIAEVLNDPAAFPPPLLLMAHTDHGPELLYRTPHSVLSIPNHRPQPGYTVTREVLDNPDPEAAEARLLESTTDVVVLCLRDATSGFFGGPESEGLYVHDLVRGRVPEGFEWVSDEPTFRIYRRAP